MENDTDAMRNIGIAIKTYGSDIGDGADAGEAAMEAAGAGNDGFSAVGAAATAATSWLGHVRGLSANLVDAGIDIRNAANEFDGIDADNGDQIDQVPDSMQLH